MLKTLPIDVEQEKTGKPKISRKDVAAGAAAFAAGVVTYEAARQAFPLIVQKATELFESFKK